MPGRRLDGWRVAGYTVEFVLDPAARRSAFGEPLGLLLDGAIEYEAVSGGRWARRELAPGRWLMVDIRYALTLLTDGCTDAVPGRPVTGSRIFRLRFDPRVAASLSDVGLADRWVQASGRAVIDFRGRISAVDVSFADGVDTLDWQWVVRWFGSPISIAMPDARTVIDRDEYLREAEEGRY